MENVLSETATVDQRDGGEMVLVFSESENTEEEK